MKRLGYLGKQGSNSHTSVEVKDTEGEFPSIQLSISHFNAFHCTMDTTIDLYNFSSEDLEKLGLMIVNAALHLKSEKRMEPSQELDWNGNLANKPAVIETNVEKLNQVLKKDV